MKLGAYLKGKREAVDISLRILARLVLVSPAHISRCENDMHKPSAELLARWADVLGLDQDDTFRRAGRLTDDMTDWLLSDGKRIAAVRKMIERNGR